MQAVRKQGRLREVKLARCGLVGKEDGFKNRVSAYCWDSSRRTRCRKYSGSSQVAVEQKVVQFLRRREGVTVEVQGMNGKWEVEESVRQRIVA